MKHEHYFKNVSRLEFIDVYRVLELFEVDDPCIQHAVKKLLVAGNRGYKDIEKDVDDAIDSLIRWKEMRKEDICPTDIISFNSKDMEYMFDGKDVHTLDLSQYGIDTIKIDEIKPLKDIDNSYLYTMNNIKIDDTKTINFGDISKKYNSYGISGSREFGL